MKRPVHTTRDEYKAAAKIAWTEVIRPWKPWKRLIVALWGWLRPRSPSEAFEEGFLMAQMSQMSPPPTSLSLRYYDRGYWYRESRDYRGREKLVDGRWIQDDAGARH